MMATLHASSRRTPEISAQGRRDALRSRWRASLRQVRPFHGDVLDADDANEIERLVEGFLAGREDCSSDAWPTAASSMVMGT